MRFSPVQAVVSLLLAYGLTAVEARGRTAEVRELIAAAVSAKLGPIDSIEVEVLAVEGKQLLDVDVGAAPGQT